MSKAKYIAKSVDSSGNLAIAIADGSVGVYANTAIANASSASLYANTGITLAQASFNAANNVMPQVQPAFDASNSASLYANTGISNAASASAYANTKVSKSGDTITGPIIISDTGSGALQVAGTVTISQDLNVSGNIFLSGSATTISSNNLTLSDPLIYLADGNIANTADIGIVGNVTNGHYYHTGLVRDHLDGTWKFFSNVTSEPTTTVNFAEANTVYDVIRVGGVISPTLTSTIATGTAPFTVTSTTAVTNLNIGGNAATATNVAYSGLTGTVPTWNQNTTGSSASCTGAWSSIPAGTVMLFVQTAAPTGWTKSTANDNAALRVVSGTAGSGGSVAFTSAFSASNTVDGTAISTAQMPAHNHGVTDPGHAHSVYDPGHNHRVEGYGRTFSLNTGSDQFRVPYTTDGSWDQISTQVRGTGIGIYGAGTGISIQNNGSGSAHSHTTTNLAVKYVDAIICTKN